MQRTPNERITLIGRTTFRNEGRPFGIARADRRHHLYLIGKTGTGKSTLLETLARQDIEAGEGLALLDPHGDLVERLVASVPSARQADLIDFDVAGAGASIGFNPLERVPPGARGLAASGLLDVFKKLWSDSWGPRVEHVLRNALFALLDQPEATLQDILRLLDDGDYRKRAAGRVGNPQVRRFWLKEYESYPARFRVEVVSPLQNKVGAFLTDPVLQRILTCRQSSFDFRRVMDERKILLVNLAKGRIGEDTAALLGSLLVSRIGLAALSRADVAESARPDFCVYLDEFQTFTTLALASMLAELRKYRVSLTLSNQYLGQLDPMLREAILGNVGTLVSFRVGPEDAEILGKEFWPEFGPGDLLALPNHHVYVKLMLGGAVSRPFSAETMGPPTS